ncbi:MAG: reductive dehalogenase [Thermonemataceae bacterium]
MESKNQSSNNSRRSFLKKVSTGTAVIASLPWLTSSCDTSSSEENDTPTKRKKRLSLFTKEYNSIDDIYEIDPNYQRMDQKNTVFNRGMWDKEIKMVMMSMLTKKGGMLPNPLLGKPGWSRIDEALAKAAGKGVDVAVGARPIGITNAGPMNNWERHTKTDVNKDKHIFASKEEAARIIKRASLFFGASVVGIAPYDERWTYSKFYNGREALMDPENGKATHEEATFPFEVKSIIVLGHEMDYEALKCPGLLNEATVQKEYASMAEVGFKVAAFLNELGYPCIPSGNDIGLSIPIAIQAGLGEISRMGLLINSKYGSRLRLSKIYTNLEIATDKPVTFGVQEFCKKCKKCAVDCPSNAISMETEPTVEPDTDSISSHPGVKKWYQNNERCFQHWERQGAGCGICVAVCPYNKKENWVHHLSEAVVSVPVGRDIARQLDDAFGYGKINEENVTTFWNQADD